MRIIAVANQKGGCGKTTVAVNLSACLAREGSRTMLLDLDPQGHCALGLAVPEEQIEYSMADLLLDRAGTTGLDLPRITWQISNNFDLAPSKTDLSTLEQRLAGVEGRESHLRAILEAHAERYDFIILDTPPTIGFLTQTALHAADEVVVPVDTGYFALHGLSKQLESMRAVSATTGRALRLHILGNLYDVRTKLAREILAELRKRHAGEILTTFINFNTKLKESTSFGQPITEFDPNSIGCRDFVRLARELIAMGAAGVPASLLEQADSLAADAEKLLATSETLLGPHRKTAPPRTPARSAAAATADAFPVEVDPSAIEASGESPTRAASQRPAPRASRPRPASDAEIDRKIARIYGVSATPDGVQFVTRVPGAQTVRVAGSFNGWNSEVTPLRRVDDEGTFEVCLPLGAGRYQYRYVVDGRWINDPFNSSVERNPFGELNNCFVVDPNVLVPAGMPD